MNDAQPIRDLDAADASGAAGLHAAAMPDPWDEASWAGFIADPSIVALGAGDGDGGGNRLVGALLIRAVADEAEILTIAVADTVRRRGLGARLLAGGLEAAMLRGANTAFLEVAVDNIAAIALYRGPGFIEIGRRQGYYRRPSGAVDALRMSVQLSTIDAGHGSN